MNIPKNLLYTKSHEWVEMTGDNTAKTGLTEYATTQLGELVFINLPEAGDSVSAGETYADVESVKAVSDVMSAVSGDVTAINEELLDSPGSINQDPYAVWLIEIGNISEKNELLTAEQYEALLAEEA